MGIGWAIAVFFGLAVVVALAGTRLTKVADQLADATGLGEALVGGVLLGAATSLPGIVTSVTAAFENHPKLAFSNAVGGIAAQTVFLAVADIVYRKANLEHASASLTSLMQGVLLILMLGFVILVIAVPSFTVVSVHPASVVLLLIYIWGTRLISRAQKRPMWKPSDTSETVTDEPDEEGIRDVNISSLVVQFVVLAVLVGFAGYFIAQTAIIIATETGISESFLGAIGTSVVTSLPELVVSISAVRQGALTLAVSNIIGGNSFDVLFLAFADGAYRNGSLYHHSDNEQLFILALTILLSGILLLGLLIREKYGIAKVGWESVLSIALFIGGYAILYFM